MFYEVTIRGCSGGFGEYEVAPDEGEGYEDRSDLLAEMWSSCSDLIDLRDDDAEALLAAAEKDEHGDKPENILGRIHNEPQEVYAMLYCRQWQYVGIGQS